MQVHIYDLIFFCIFFKLSEDILKICFDDRIALIAERSAPCRHIGDDLHSLQRILFDDLLLRFFIKKRCVSWVSVHQIRIVAKVLQHIIFDHMISRIAVRIQQIIRIYEVFLCVANVVHIILNAFSQ